MSEQRIGVLLFSLLLAITISGCMAGGGRTIVLGTWDPTRQALEGAVVRGGRVGNCVHPPAPFEDTHLVGTWVDNLGMGIHTTLVLRDDYTYTQEFDSPDSGEHYRSAGDQRWWVERRESGIPLLHLEGMPDCENGWGVECKGNPEPGGGVWWDWCTGASIRFKDEVVLLITGVHNPPMPPRGLLLRYLKDDPDTPVGAFELQE